MAMIEDRFGGGARGWGGLPQTTQPRSTNTDVQRSMACLGSRVGCPDHDYHRGQSPLSGQLHTGIRSRIIIAPN